MKYKISNSILAVTTLLLMQNCTTAIIDQGDVSLLPPLMRTVSYQSDVDGIMYNNCITCHGGNSPSDGLDLSNYQNTKTAAEQRNLIQRMNNLSNPMPSQGVLSLEIRQIMDKWITDGLLEQ
ncbi:hypothetical protein [Winogradskyella sp.]|uniref:hypothetical protein n=1 Tax=Winogradskyella sp. TaxID=1883156 RepID=UPI0025FC84B1|nr:hypothetical protein [Winogradskyella sp.]